MSARVPTEEEVLGYFESLSNWGRWGEEDQLGTLNFLSSDKTKRAASLIREGMTVSCARTVSFDPSPDAPNPPVHFMVESGEGWAHGGQADLSGGPGLHRLLRDDFSRPHGYPHRQPCPLLLGGTDV